MSNHTPDVPGPDLLPGPALLVPGLGLAAGDGRSQVTALLAATCARVARTVVLDASAPALSAWESSAAAGQTVVSTWRHDAIRTLEQVLAAASGLGTDGWDLQSLTTLGTVARGPRPQRWVRLGRLGGWPGTIADAGQLALCQTSGARR